jgi:hypothetical protein
LKSTKCILEACPRYKHIKNGNQIARLQNGEQQYVLHPENSHAMFNSVFAAPVLLQAVVIAGRVKGREYRMLDGLPGPIVVGRGGIVVVVAVPWSVVESETPPPCELPAAVVVMVGEVASAVDVWATGPC